MKFLRQLFRIVILVIASLGCGFKTFGQEPIQRPAIKFQHINRELSNNQVFTILQDRAGFFWIGTIGGLHRLRGNDYDLFTASKDSTSLHDNRVEEIFEDTRGRLWIGTYDGVSRYNPDTDDFIRYETPSDITNPLDPNMNRIKEIVEDKNGTIWVGSQRSGLFYFDEKSQSFVSLFTKATGNLLGTTNVTAIRPDEDNILWIGTLNDGLKKLDTKKKEVVHFRHQNKDEGSIAGNSIASIAIDKKGNVWVATYYWGVDRIAYEGSSVRFVHYRHDPKNPNSLGNNDPRVLYVDSKNNLWSCNENGGISLYSEKHDVFFTYLPDPLDPFSISSNSYWCTYEDRQGRLWFGSPLNGIDVIDKNLNKFDHYYKSSTSGKSLSNDIVRGFYEDKDGNLWIATDGGGLNFLDRKTNTYKAYRHELGNPKSIQSDAVLSICEVNNELWVGTWQGGINVLDEKRKSFRQIEPGNENLRSVFKVIKASDGSVWACGYDGGIQHFDATHKIVRSYLNDPSNPSSVSSNIVPIIIEDSDGNIWAGTQDSGVSLMKKENIEKGIFQRFGLSENDSLGLPSKLINDIFEDSKKNIWIATAGGLSKYSKTKNIFKNYSTKNGLAVDHIKSIIEDNKGFLWIGTAKGISKYNPFNETFINYDTEDGLQRGEFSRYGVYKTRNGELIFGGTNGFNAFYPDSIRNRNFFPPVYITGLRVFNKPVLVGDKDSVLPKPILRLDEITVPYDYSVFTLEFAALNNIMPDKREYAYKLEPLESNWNFVGNQHTATYTNLDPGEYHFRVKASNDDGAWEEDEKTLKITVTPPFWRAWWFKILLITFLSSSIYVAIYMRVRHLRKKNIKLEARVNDRTAQLRGLINELQEKQNEIASTNEELTSTLEDLVVQKNKVESINNDLKSAHEELLAINNQLDERVNERTLKLVKANQELDRFVYSASHDLSAPLKSILGLIQLTRLENKNEELTNHLDHMQKSVLKLEGVINSLTQFSRNMGHAIVKQEFIFDEMINEVLDELKYPFHTDKVKIIKDYNASAFIISDYLRLKIILSNLISNALKYKKSNGSDSFVYISYQNNNESNVIQIKDNGIGISTENQLKVFDMFFRATLQSNGSGLGLYIVKETVEKLGGKITLESAPSSYTMFTVVL
jgi:ligand-binding sensor domain-containing protein/signal transduction histidine kinase